MTPALLLIPGMLNDATLWSEVALSLRPLADVRIAAPVQLSISAMAQSAWTLIADLPLQQPVVLAGFSLGGYVVIEMLAGRAGVDRRLQAATLISTTDRPDSAGRKALREKAIHPMHHDFRQVVDSIVERSMYRPSMAQVEATKQMMLSVGPDVAIRQLRAIADRSDHRVALSRLSLPVTVLCGRHDRITPPALSEEMACRIPQARCEIVEEAGHMLPVEQPQAVVAALREQLVQEGLGGGRRPTE